MTYNVFGKTLDFMQPNPGQNAPNSI